MRPTIEDFFMGMAEYYGRRNTCPRANGACVLVKDERIIGAGYVSAPPKQPHCTDVGCEIEEESRPGIVGVEQRCRRTLHAEQSLLAACAKFGIVTNESCLFTVTAPCYDCSKMLLVAGIITVTYTTPYRDFRGLRLLEESRVSVRKHKAPLTEADFVGKKLSEIMAMKREREDEIGDGSI